MSNFLYGTAIIISFFGAGALINQKPIASMFLMLVGAVCLTLMEKNEDK